MTRVWTNLLQCCSSPITSWGFLGKFRVDILKMLWSIINVFITVSFCFIILFLAIFYFFLLTLVGFHWSLNDSKSLQVSRTLQSILSVWRVSILPLIFISSSLFSKLLESVPRAPTKIGITVTLMYHSFLVLWQSSSICLSFHFLLVLLCGPPGQQNPLDDN